MELVFIRFKQQPGKALIRSNMSLFLAVFLALCAHAALGSGNVLMKRGIAWIGWTGDRNRHFFTQLLIWLTGFLIMNSSGVFTALAVKRLSPQEVAAFAGFGILAMIFLSRMILAESLYLSDIPGTAMIIIAITLLGLDPAPELTSVWSNPKTIPLILIFSFPFLFLLLGIIWKKKAAVAFALSSGQASGILIILLKLLVVRYEYRIVDYFSSLYLYLYIIFALLALLCLQFALKKGALMLVGPLQYSSLILYPALCAPLLGASLPIRHWPLFLLSVAGIWIIMRRR